MTRQNSTLTLSKSQSATNVSTLEHESPPTNDISWSVLRLLPRSLDPSKVVSVVLRGDHFGSWETPIEQREAGFTLMAVDANGNEKHVKGFQPSQLSVSAIKQECDEIAKALGATLIDTSINFNLPQVGFIQLIDSESNQVLAQRQGANDEKTFAYLKTNVWNVKEGLAMQFVAQTEYVHPVKFFCALPKSAVVKVYHNLTNSEPTDVKPVWEGLAEQIEENNKLIEHEQWDAFDEQGNWIGTSEY